MLKAIYRKIINWVMSTETYHYILKNIVPYIRFTLYYTSLRGWKYHKLYKVLQPGDIILTIDEKKLTTLLIPGEFSHAGMCVSKDGLWEVSEMTHTDYTKSTFFDLCKESDRVVILRCKNCTSQQIEEAIERCKSYEGAVYDVKFKFCIKALYCSELVYQSYADNLLEANLEDLVGLGRPYISPNGLYKAKNVYVVMDSSKLEK